MTTDMLFVDTIDTGFSLMDETMIVVMILVKIVVMIVAMIVTMIVAMIRVMILVLIVHHCHYSPSTTVAHIFCCGIFCRTKLGDFCQTPA